MVGAQVALGAKGPDSCSSGNRDATNESGEFDFHASFPGNAPTLHVTALGYVPESLRGIGSGGFYEVRLRSQRGAICGAVRVATSGEPIGGAFVRCSNALERQEARECRTDNLGRYCLRDLPAGLYTVAAAHSDYRERLQTVSVQEAAAELDFALDEAQQIRGYVVDAITADGVPGVALDDGYRTVETDVSGYFSMPGPPPRYSELTVRATKKGWVPQLFKVSQSDASSGVEVRFEMQSGGRFALRVALPSGVGQSELVSAFSQTYRGMLSSSSGTVQALPSGEYLVEAGSFSGAGLVQSRIQAPQCVSVSAKASAWDGSEQSVAALPLVELTPGTRVVGIVCDSLGNRISGVSATAFVHQGLDATSSWRIDRETPNSVRGLADVNGRFVLEGMPLGMHAVVLYHRGFAKTTWQLNVDELHGDEYVMTRPLVLDDLPSGPEQLCGRVVRGNGNPLAGSHVSLLNSVGDRWIALTSKEGEFVLDDLPAHRYDVHVSYLLEGIPKGVYVVRGIEVTRKPLLLDVLKE